MGLEVEVVGEGNKFDVIVIGGGVAGMVASTLVTNSGLKSCFLEKEVPGGKLMQIEEVHNFDQYPGIRGADLASGIFNSAVEGAKTTYANGNVVAMKARNELFYLYTEDGITWEAKAIIVATGTVVKKLGLDNATKFENKGLSYCVLCDSSLAKDKHVVMIGSQAHIEHLKPIARSITVLKPEEVKDIIGYSYVQGVMKTDGSVLPCDMCFVQLGFVTSNKFLIQDVYVNAAGEVIVNDKMATSFPGVYACGDCTNSPIKLISKAIEQANIAANEVVTYIKSRKW